MITCIFMGRSFDQPKTNSNIGLHMPVHGTAFKFLQSKNSLDAQCRKEKMFRYSFPVFDLNLRPLNLVQITRNIKDAYHIIEYTILSHLKYPLSTVLPMNDTSQPEGQHAANSLSNALGGEEVFATCI